MTQELIDIIVREGYGKRPISGDTLLVDLDMDSLEFIQLVQCIRAELGAISTREIQYANTVAELARAIAVVQAT